MADGAGGAWTFGGSILTFAFPMILFIVVAGALYVLYTKPESVPGHRAPGLQRSVSYTAMPGEALGHEARGQAAVESARARPAAAGTAGIITGAAAETPAAETSGEAAETSGEAAGTEGAE
jgi:hypothetical protein